MLQSAFDSAGQRCSALRVLFIQDEVAERTIRMLRGAPRRTDGLATRTGSRPTSDRLFRARARDTILAHVEAMRDSGHTVHALPLPSACARGTFVAPTIIELDDASECRQEVFGPVLHVVRYRRENARRRARRDRGQRLWPDVSACTRALTRRSLGSRGRSGPATSTSTETSSVLRSAFSLSGATGLSGTGPKAGGPLYLGRLVAKAGSPAGASGGVSGGPALAALVGALDGRNEQIVVRRIAGMSGDVPIDRAASLPGPVGEQNEYRLKPRGTVSGAGRDGVLGSTPPWPRPWRRAMPS